MACLLQRNAITRIILIGCSVYVVLFLFDILLSIVNSDGSSSYSAFRVAYILLRFIVAAFSLFIVYQMKKAKLKHRAAMRACLTLFMLLALIPAIRGDINNAEPYPQKSVRRGGSPPD